MQISKKKFPCRICGKSVRDKQNFILCSSCDSRIHVKCYNSDFASDDHFINLCFKFQDENLPFFSSKSNDTTVKIAESPFLRNIRNLLNSSEFFDTGDISSNSSPESNEPLINCKDLDANNLNFEIDNNHVILSPKHCNS